MSVIRFARVALLGVCNRPIATVTSVWQCVAGVALIATKHWRTTAGTGAEIGRYLARNLRARALPSHSLLKRTNVLTPRLAFSRRCAHWTAGIDAKTTNHGHAYPQGSKRSGVKVAALGIRAGTG